MRGQTAGLLLVALLGVGCSPHPPAAADEETSQPRDDQRSDDADTDGADTNGRPAVDGAIVDGSVVEGMVRLDGGEFSMGTAGGPPHEQPVHRVRVRPFWIDVHEVTVAQFREFVETTDYVTEAERFGWSGVFDTDAHEWTKGDGATWQAPEGPGSEAHDEEPVTQVSWNDVAAYARWAGKRLPTEAEWELAARGGLEQQPYAWGDELTPDGAFLANWWQGPFPAKNLVEDGFERRAPVGSFPPNGFGLHDMIGNVWEWCADWFDPAYYAASAREETPRADPQGPRRGDERVIRGGSWMCSHNFCTNYRPGARSSATPDTGLNNVGFRCAKDVDPADQPTD